LRCEKAALERLTRAERVKNGVPVDDETWRELTVAARAVNVLVEAPARPGS
jgi:LDH2 family malate/lactate/ureidoglycolate dehydrogenase